MDVTMPQLGETVTEGTITKWLKGVGERVEPDEPLFEVSTDKVDSEVPAPAGGVVSEILVEEGETVDVGTRLAVLTDGAAGAAPAPADTRAGAETRDEPEAAPPPAPAPPAEPDRPAAPAAPPAPAAAAAPVPPPPAHVEAPVLSPIVRRLAAERGVDPSTLAGTGVGGRVTRNDILAASPVAARPTEPVAPAPGRSSPGSAAPGAAAPGPALAVGEAQAVAPPRGDEVIPFDNIRRRTAEHVVRSKATSAHVYTSAEVDFEHVERARAAHGAEWKVREGFSLTYLPFIARAFCDAVAEYPRVNASIDGESLIVHHDVHLGIAVDLDFAGLLAPVIRDADGKRIRLLAREIRELASRARNKGLLPGDVIGGTFTITNMGPYGTLMTLPIINQPQVAILATDGIVKRPVVVEGPDGDDAIAVHPVGVLALTWDHRAFDGAYAASFLRAMKEILEQRDWKAELA